MHTQILYIQGYTLHILSCERIVNNIWEKTDEKKEKASEKEKDESKIKRDKKGVKCGGKGWESSR